MGRGGTMSLLRRLVRVEALAQASEPPGRPCLQVWMPANGPEVSGLGRSNARQSSPSVRHGSRHCFEFIAHKLQEVNRGADASRQDPIPHRQNRRPDGVVGQRQRAAN